MIGVIVPYLSKIRRSYQSNDLIDRLSYEYTAMIITLAAFTLAATQYVGNPIQCWVPAQFTGAWEKYTETYCFIKGSYFLPLDDDIPYEFNQREDAMDFLIDYLKLFKIVPDGSDSIDTLNHYYTAMLLMISGISMSAMIYVAHPIQCWVPAEFQPQVDWEHYAEMYCFTNGFYFRVEDCYLDKNNSERICVEDRQVHIGYYQWLPLIAVLQAFMFAAPLYFWRVNSSKTGINVKGVLNSAASVKKKFDRGSRIAQVHIAADHLQEALDMQRELKGIHSFASFAPFREPQYHRGFDCLRFGKRNGVYLVALYLFTKLLYVLNVLMQFVILNAFLGPQYTFWGAGILSDIWNGKEWNESGHFPRVTMCDFDVRVMGNIHRWTVQCVLMINMFNEKIYIFLWWWFVLVGILTIISFFYYVIALTVATNQRQFVTRYLRCTGAISKQSNSRNDDHLNSFINKFLRPDGVFLLRLIESNGGDLLVGEVVSALFNRYRARMEDHLDTLPVTESPNSSASIHHN
ncbi:unnamed protein product [Anisakis simplex]|uniref:Innexin n=1 Tax=Anisakis simplex TaxID=6269 RepID=A0A0M3JXE9_ANISI|nr:unnamed protein product [Anisakis simplex]